MAIMNTDNNNNNDENEMFERFGNTSLIDPSSVVDAADNSSQEIALRKEQELEKDSDYARNKLKEIIELSEEVLDHAGAIAMETGEPQSIKAYAELTKTMVDAVNSVMDNNKVKASIERDRMRKSGGGLDALADAAEASGASITQNNQTIFVGTTKELHKLLNESEDDPVIIDIDSTTES